MAADRPHRIFTFCDIDPWPSRPAVLLLRELDHTPSACGGSAATRVAPAGLGWHEALGDQAVPHQIGDPLGILRIGLALHHVERVPGRCRRSARNAPRARRRPGANRSPCSPCRRASLPPAASPAALRGPASPCETSAPFCSVAPRAADQKARHHRLLIHLQATAPLDRLHHRPLPSEGDRDAAGTFETQLACSPSEHGGDRCDEDCPLHGASGPEHYITYLAPYRSGDDDGCRGDREEESDALRRKPTAGENWRDKRQRHVSGGACR